MRIKQIIFVTVLLLVIGLVFGCQGSPRPRGSEEGALGALCDPPPRGCTIFTASHGERVFFGGNGDWVNFDSNYYWVDPGNSIRFGTPGHGAIYFGKPDNVQQGFNEQGLAYDSNGLPSAPVNVHPGWKPVRGGHTSYPIQILRACATVEDVIAWVQEHQWPETMHYQMHFADASGDAVVISAGPDGQVAFTRKQAGDGFLVSTNFNLANPLNGSYPCWRYDRAEALLKEIDNSDELTAEHAASVLNAVHVASPSGFTILSVLGDLPQGLVYVYLFHQFDAPIILNVEDEIARAPDPGPLRDLFPPETVAQVDEAYQRLMARPARCDAVGLAWLGVVAVSFVALLILAQSRRQRLALWMLVVSVLGPVGLLAWLISTRGRQNSALVETVGDLVPYVVGMVAALVTVIFVPAVSQTSLLQLLAFYGFPLAIGLFLYQAPLLVLTTRGNYARTVLRRLPAVLVSTNWALAGLLAIGLPLFKQHLDYCGLGNLTILLWWAIAVLGALAGGLLLYVYHTWAVRRGFVAWSALLLETGVIEKSVTVVCSPAWRRLWLWILLSFAGLITGMAFAATGVAP